MKKIILALFLSGTLGAQAQKKPLPAACPELQQKLLQIKQSISNLSKFKKTLVPGKTGVYTTSISICGVTGELELYGDNAELIFKFTSEQFNDEDDELLPVFVNNVRKVVKKVFGDNFEEEAEESEDDLWGNYQTITYRPYTGTYPRIEIDYPFADDLCWIRFEYGK